MAEERLAFYLAQNKNSVGENFLLTHLMLMLGSPPAFILTLANGHIAISTVTF